MNRVEKAHQYLVEMFDISEYLSNNLESKKYRYEHSIRVANIGRIIAKGEGFNEEAFVIACLLHDIGYVCDFESEDDWLNHGRTSAKIARDFIISLGFDSETTNDMIYGIAIHVDEKADFEGVNSPFALAIRDADNIDRFDTYRIFETLKNYKFDELSLDEKIETCEKRISNLNRLLLMDFATPTSTKLFHDKIRYQAEFYNRLLNQLKISKL